VIDQVSETPEDAVRDRDLVVYAAPLSATLELMEAHAATWGDAAVTDVVSLKRPLLERARERGFAARYVGAHPMVGGTGTGFRASVDDLFVDRPVWLTPGDAGADAVERVEGLWRSLGARTRTIDASDHDARMAWVSHLPQLLATALASVVAEQGFEAAELGPGGRDMTRLAASSWDMWRDLVEASRELDVGALEALERELATMRETLASGRWDELGKLIDRMRTWRGRG
jgi:prephenate dehydrogenase